MIWVIIIASVGGLLLLAIARAPHEDPPPSGNASSADYLEALQKKQKEQNEQKEQETLARKRAEQRSLEDKYANSPLTRRIIDAISDGTGQLPEEITVYDDRVTGRTNGQMRTFDFAANRVPVFDQVHKCMAESGEEELLLRPQVALGNAINRILNGQYDVSDKAIRRHEQMGRSDVYIYFFHYYTSDHVLLRLEATNHW